MNGSLLQVLSFALLPVATAISGSILATYRPPGPSARSYIQHFAAGVVFSVVAVELLPSIMQVQARLQLTIGFALGVAAMLALSWFAGRPENESRGDDQAGILLAVGVDILLDGLLIGIAFAAGEEQGRLLTFALAAEMLSLGLAVSSALGRSGWERKNILLTTSLLFLLVLLGATAGATLLKGITAVALEGVLAFGLAALLFLVTEELLVEAHQDPETPLATATFFAGFLLFLLLGMAGG